MTRVLVVDDEPTLRRAVSINLRARGYDVTLAEDGATALRLASDTHPDVVLLDLGLPDIDGVEVIAGIRGWSSVPIIVLSARRSSDDKVQALDAGADDYVTKPFGMDEMVARLRAAVRRGRPADAGSAITTTASFTVDLAAKRVRRDGVDVRLTPTEWGLLEILVRNPGSLVGRKALLRDIWGPAVEDQAHYLRVYIGQLRRKLEPDPTHPRYLLTEAGMGYRFQPEPEPGLGPEGASTSPVTEHFTP